jgi:hypothetical protein
MRVNEIAKVVDFVVDDAPEVVGLVVGSDRLTGERGVRHGRRTRKE